MLEVPTAEFKAKYDGDNIYKYSFSSSTLINKSIRIDKFPVPLMVDYGNLSVSLCFGFNSIFVSHSIPVIDGLVNLFEQPTYIPYLPDMVVTFYFKPTEELDNLLTISWQTMSIHSIIRLEIIDRIDLGLIPVTYDEHCIFPQKNLIVVTNDQVMIRYYLPNYRTDDWLKIKDFHSLFNADTVDMFYKKIVSGNPLAYMRLLLDYIVTTDYVNNKYLQNKSSTSMVTHLISVRQYMCA